MVWGSLLCSGNAQICYGLVQELHFDQLACRLALYPVLLSSRGQVCVKIAIAQAIHLLQNHQEDGTSALREASTGKLDTQTEL